MSPILSDTRTARAKWLRRDRARHHIALEDVAWSIDPASKLPGLQIWRRLRRIEAEAGAIAMQLCNGPDMSEEEREARIAKVTGKVVAVFGTLPPGFFVNLDPRGYALKLRPGSVSFALYEDWGKNQILAPTID